MVGPRKYAKKELLIVGGKLLCAGAVSRVLSEPETNSRALRMHGLQPRLLKLVRVCSKRRRSVVQYCTRRFRGQVSQQDIFDVPVRTSPSTRVPVPIVCMRMRYEI